MSKPLRVDLFVEDIAHEKLLMGLVKRVGREENAVVLCQVRSARGGRARVISEFRIHQNLLAEGMLGSTADLIVAAVDSNCSTFAKTRSEIQAVTRSEFQHRTVSACPDPHIERWYMADPNSFYKVVGYRPVLGPEKCERDHYKQILRTAIQKAGHPAILDGIEFAGELAEAMDLYRAGKADASLKAFLDDLRTTLRRLVTER